MTGTRKNLVPDKISIGNLAGKSHIMFRVSIFPFLQKWHHAYLWGAYSEAEVSHPDGYFLEFQPHPVQERMSPHPTQNIMTLNLTFVPANQNSLAWATLHFAILHHCISMLKDAATGYVSVQTVCSVLQADLYRA